MDFDLGTNAIDIIFLRDFYGRVLKDLGLHQGVVNIPEELEKMENFLAKIGALAEI